MIRLFVAALFLLLTGGAAFAQAPTQAPAPETKPTPGDGYTIHVTAAHLNFRRAKPKPHGANKVGLASHQVPDTLIDAGRAHPDEHVVVPDHRPVDVPGLQDVG